MIPLAEFVICRSAMVHSHESFGPFFITEQLLLSKRIYENLD
jgi:hypothetical protein